MRRGYGRLTSHAPPSPPTPGPALPGPRPSGTLALITVLGLGLRLGYIALYRRHATPAGDAYYYHYQANLLVGGHGFINPLTYAVAHRAVPAADHPPLWTLVLAVAALVGLKSFWSQIVWSCLVGAAAIVVVALATHEIAGRRAGIAAAFLAACYPVFWINDGALMSETLVLLTSALVVWQSYRLRRRPSLGAAFWLGTCCGLGALTRSELFLVVPILAAGVALTRVLPTRRRAGAAGLLIVVGAMVPLTPWWIYNSSRFADPVLLSSQLGVTLAGANCPATYSGPLLGYWSFGCDLDVHPAAHTDASQQDGEYRHAALQFAQAHVDRLPLVALARVGRELGLYRPFEQVDLEWNVLGRPRAPAVVGLLVWYVSAALGVVGAVLLHRRRVPLLPFAALALDVVVVAAVTFGQTRYRVALDATVVMLAGVAIGWLSEPPARLRLRLRLRLRGMPAVSAAEGSTGPGPPEPSGPPGGQSAERRDGSRGLAAGR
ncbi:MAG TPA: glycosyltransferase family 39 protein [Acidimicrobiales bacterium]